MAILAAPWKVRMAAVSKGGTEGLVAITAQITLQQLIHISSENKGSKLHPMSLSHFIPAPLLCSTSHSPWWEPQFLRPGRCPSILHRLLTKLQWICAPFPPEPLTCRLLLPCSWHWGLQVFSCLVFARHNGDPLKKPPLHLCLSASALWKKINIAVCC